MVRRLYIKRSKNNDKGINFLIMFNHDTFKQTDTTFNGIYIGCVEDNKDPEKMGRVRVRIAGLHTPKKEKTNTGGIPTDELPWCMPANSTIGGSVSGIGDYGVPVQGSWVALFFIGGDHNNPIYFATISGNPQSTADTSVGFNDPDGVHPNIVGEPDWNREARGEGTIKDIKNNNLETFEPVSTAEPEYPYNDVYEGQNNGLVVERDSTPNKERWHVYHKASKSYFEILENGDMVMKSTNNKYEITTNDRKVFVKNNDTQQIDGALTLTVGGKVDIIGTLVDIDGGSGSPLGVVTKACKCAFTGQDHPDFSSNVKASK